MSQKVLVAILVISLGVAVYAGYYGRSQWLASGVQIAVVAAAQPIPPYTPITADMLTERQMPEALSREPVYLRASEVVGKIASVPIPAQGLIYHDFAVPAESFRLTSDPALEVVSFPVRPEKAVGGQVRPGQRINIYRVAISSQATYVSPEQALSSRAAEAQVLASNVLVADVRTGQGEQPSNSSSAQDTRDGSAPAPMRSRSASVSGPATIISVAVKPEVAGAIIALVGETRGPYDLWVTLSPLNGEGLPLGASASVEGENK